MIVAYDHIANNGDECLSEKERVYLLGAC